MYIFQPDRSLLQKQIQKVGRFVTGNVLDVGAGEFNRYEKHFKPTKYTKMDVHEGPNVDVVGSIEKIPFPDGHFDSVVCTQVFEHLPHPVESAREVSRVLKKGGHLVMTVPQMNELHEEPHDYFRYTNFGLTTLFKEAGFEIVSIEARGGFYTTLAQMITRYSIDKCKLYKRGIIGRIVGKILHVFSKAMMWFDTLDTSAANRKHTIGWCVVCKKI
jgi:SAM-dependent methyltransferase